LRATQQRRSRSDERGRRQQQQRPHSARDAERGHARGGVRLAARGRGDQHERGAQAETEGLQARERHAPRAARQVDEIAEGRKGAHGGGGEGQDDDVERRLMASVRVHHERNQQEPDRQRTRCHSLASIAAASDGSPAR
jgi:hypothetical protein